MSEVISQVMWGRQLEAKVEDLLATAGDFLGDGSSFERLSTLCTGLVGEVMKIIIKLIL